MKLLLHEDIVCVLQCFSEGRETFYPSISKWKASIQGVSQIGNRLSESYGQLVPVRMIHWIHGSTGDPALILRGSTARCFLSRYDFSCLQISHEVAQSKNVPGHHCKICKELPAPRYVGSVSENDASTFVDEMDCYRYLDWQPCGISSEFQGRPSQTVKICIDETLHIIDLHLRRFGHRVGGA